MIPSCFLRKYHVDTHVSSCLKISFGEVRNRNRDESGRDPLVGNKNRDPNFRLFAPSNFASVPLFLSLAFCLTLPLSHSGLIALIHIHGNLFDEPESC